MATPNAIQALAEWFSLQKRNFPWRERKNPYRVWVSEVMLQQTRADVVVPYFLRWIDRFPTVEALASANEQEVLKAWEGLGYYSRARNLHRAAQVVVEKFGGIIPDSKEGLLSLPGLGPYTAGAILSFAFERPTPAIDANVLRVMSRFFLIEEEISSAKARKKALQGVLSFLAPSTMEALIELGATLCQKKPLCEKCPLSASCEGALSGKAPLFPYKKEAPPITPLHRFVPLIEGQKSLLVQRHKVGKIMGGLFELPYFDGKEEVLDLFDLSLEKMGELPIVTHTFTRYFVTLYPIYYRCKAEKKVDGFEWIALDRLRECPFSAGHKRIIDDWRKQHEHHSP